MTDNDKRVEELAAKATEGFFAELFKHVPAGTTGDFPPDATMAFEQAAKDAVRTILLNAPAKRYVIAYEVDWQPETDDPDEDAPLDQHHSLEVEDSRISDYRIIAIGSPGDVRNELWEHMRKQD